MIGLSDRSGVAAALLLDSASTLESMHPNYCGWVLAGGTRPFLGQVIARSRLSRSKPLVSRRLTPQ
jgi:hypothetical protein